MVVVHFYGKPGCIGNAKQQQLLQVAGHIVQVHNLLTEPWTPERLLTFLGDRPVTEWFNPTAPPIKAGIVNPDVVSAADALALLIQQPILIRRPLLQVGDRAAVGFDLADIDAWIGLSPDSDRSQDVQTCPRTTAA